MTDDYPIGINQNDFTDNGLLPEPDDYKNDDFNTQTPTNNNNYQYNSYQYPSDENNYPYSSNMPNQNNFSSNEYPNNPSPKGIETNQNYLIQTPRPRCINLLLIVSIVLFIFLILDIIVLEIINELFSVLLIIDQIGILLVAIIFLLSFFIMCDMNFKAKGGIAVGEMCIGTFLRGIGMIDANTKDCTGIYYGFIIIKGVLFFVAISIGYLIHN